MQELLLPLFCLISFARITEAGSWPGSEHWSSFKSIFRVNKYKVRTKPYRYAETGTRELEHLESGKQRDAQMRLFINTRFCKDIVSVHSLAT